MAGCVIHDRVGFPEGQFGYIFVKRQGPKPENTARRSCNQNHKTLKRRGSGGSRGFGGIAANSAIISQATKRVGPTLQPPKTSASSATSAFQGFAVNVRFLRSLRRFSLFFLRVRCVLRGWMLWLLSGSAALCFKVCGFAFLVLCKKCFEILSLKRHFPLEAVLVQ